MPEGEGTRLKVDGDRIIARLLAHIDGGYYNYLTVQNHHYGLARDWIGHFTTPLRTFDAFHLAIASAEALLLVTADKMLASAPPNPSV